MDVELLKTRVIADVDDAKRELKATAVEFKGVSLAASDSSAGLKQFALAGQQLKLDSLTNNLDLQQRQLGILKQRLTETSTKYSEGSTQVLRAALAVDAMTARINQNQAALGLQQAKLQATIAAEQAAVSQTNALSSSITNLDQATTKSSTSISAMSQIAIGGLRRIGSEIVSNIGPAIGSVIGIGSSYQTTMNVLQASSSASTEQMAQMAAQSKALGADLSLPGTSASDAATAMLELNKAGLSVNETMAAAKGVLQLSAAAQIDNANAAQITANALNAFGLQGAEANRVANLLAGGANASSASITDLAQGMQQGAFSFEATGQSIEDLITAVAALTNVGYTGSDGATALKNAMIQLMAPTDGAAATMKQYGIEVRGASGQILPFQELIAHLKDRLGGLAPAQRDMALKTMLQSDGMKAMIPLLKLGADGFEDLKVKVTANNAAGNMAAAQMKGLAGATEGLKSTLQTAALKGIEPLLPLLEDMVRGATTVAASFSDWVGPAATKLAGTLREAQQGAKLVKDGFESTAQFLDKYGTPIMYAAAAAVAAYTLAISGGLYGALFAAATVIGGFTTVIITATGATIAATAAIAAMAIPLTIIAAAVGGVALAWQNYNDIVENGPKRLLEQNKFYQDSNAVLEQHTQALGGASQATKQHAAELAAMQKAMQDQFRETDPDNEAEMDALRGTRDLLIQKTQAVHASMAADREMNQAVATSTMGLHSLRESASQVSLAFADMTLAQQMEQRASQLNQEQLSEINKELERLAKEGPKAFGEFVNGEIAFSSDRVSARSEHAAKIKDLETELANASGQKAQEAAQKRLDTERAGYQESERAAALSYATQQSQAAQHYGQMLIDYFQYEGKRRGMTEDQIKVITDALRVEYGIHESIQSQAYGKIIASADALIASGGANVEAFIAQSKSTLGATIENEARWTELMTSGTASLQQQYDERKITLSEYNARLLDLPAQVTTQVNLEAQQAVESAARAQDAINQIPNHMQSQAFLDINNVDMGVTDATAKLNSIPRETLTQSYLDAKGAQLEAQDYQGTLKMTPATISTSVQLIGTAAAKAAAQSLGADIAAGVAAGIAGSQGKMNAAMVSATSGVVQAGRNSVQARSPARVPWDLIGVPIGQGIAGGISSQAGAIGGALSGVLQETIGGISGQQPAFEAAMGSLVEQATGSASAIQAQMGQMVDSIRKGHLGLSSSRGSQSIYDQVLSSVSPMGGSSSMPMSGSGAFGAGSSRSMLPQLAFQASQAETAIAGVAAKLQALPPTTLTTATFQSDGAIAAAAALGSRIPTEIAEGMYSQQPAISAAMDSLVDLVLGKAAGLGGAISSQLGMVDLSGVGGSRISGPETSLGPALTGPSSPPISAPSAPSQGSAFDRPSSYSSSSSANAPVVDVRPGAKVAASGTGDTYNINLIVNNQMDLEAAADYILERIRRKA